MSERTCTQVLPEEDMSILYQESSFPWLEEPPRAGKRPCSSRRSGEPLVSLEETLQHAYEN